jgi:acyl-coenzyme A thioesterase PaaI-like protein
VISPACSPALPAGFPLPDERNGYRTLLDMIVGGTAPDPPVIRKLEPPRPSQWSPGSLTVFTTFEDDHTWTSGVIFGGYIACLLDLYGGLVMLTVLPDTASFLTAHLDVSFRKPTTPELARIDARVVEISARHALTEVTVSQDGDVTSRGLTTQAISRLPAATT